MIPIDNPKQDKEPKRWECRDDDCKFISKRVRTAPVFIEGQKRTKYVCYKCSANVKESEEWLSWYNRQTKRMWPLMKSWMESRKAR